MPLKRPVTVAQARRWPASAKRRESFCARMGGMRERLTSPEVAADPASAINRSLAAWDCDDPEGLRPEHVSKGIRMKVTMSKVGSETRKENPPSGVKWAPKKKKPKVSYAIMPKTSYGRGIMVAEFSTKARAEEYLRSMNFPWNYRIKKREEYEYEDPPEENPAPAPAKKTRARSAAPKVWSVFADRAENPVAMFRTREDAVTFAQARANTTGKQMRVAEE